MNFIKGVYMIKKVDDALNLGIFNSKTGGHTRCRFCKCVIENDEFYTYEKTNKICTGCGHYYYDHDVFN